MLKLILQSDAKDPGRINGRCSTVRKKNKTRVKKTADGRKTTAAKPIWIAWLRILRLHFVITSILPAILGAVIALAHGYAFNWLHFALVIVGVSFNHFALHLVDDVLDYRQAVNLKKGDEKNYFTGGSGVLPEGLLSEKSILRAAGFLFGITFIIGVYLTWVCGWPILMLGLFGMASSLFYTTPPIKYSYRGFGELGLLLNFGPVIVLGAYYVQTRTFTWEPLIASLVLGLMMWSMILINEIPDYETDRQGGKWNLVARFGKKSGAFLYVIGLFLAYGILLLSAYSGMMPTFVLLGLLSLPLAVKSIPIMLRHLDDPLRMTPANLAMVKVHALTGTAMIAAYLLTVHF